MDKARIRDLEGLYSAALHKIGELEAQCATAEDEIYTLIQDRMKIQSHLAAMREALEAAIAKPSWEFQHVAKADVMEILDTTDAGRALLERLRKAEASLEAYMKWETNIRQMNNVPDDMSLTDWASAVTERIGTLNTLLDKAEAERVEAVPTDGRSLCEMAACPHWNDGDCLVLSCGVKYMYDFLLTHNMIREAE